jgi:hypothetical protein
MREMFEQNPESPLGTELVSKGKVWPPFGSQSASGSAGIPNALGAASSMASDIRSERLLPALVAETSPPRRNGRALPFGILFYLLSVGVVATATVGVFFGIGFFLLAQPTEAMSANAGNGEHDSSTRGSFSRALSNGPPTHGDTASVPIDPQIPRSVATAELAAVALAPSGQPSPAGDASAGDVKDLPFGKEAPGSEVREASPRASLPVTPAAKPTPETSSAAEVPEETPHLSATQITDLLARGDSFLHAGDVASARLFYERAADAGDWQAAMRMGATFDPAFLSRAGVHTVGDPTKAQSWYRHALDLDAAKTHRQVESTRTK